MSDRYELPALSVVILLRPEADRADLTGRLERRLPSGTIIHDFRYLVVRVWEKPVEQLLKGGLATLPLAPLADVCDEDLPAVIRTMADRIEHEASPEVAGEIWTSTYVLMGLRYSVEQTVALLRGALDMKESVTFQAILDEGRKKGRQQGRQQGREEGKLQEARDLLIRVGRERLGSPSASYVNRIKRIKDRLQLAELLVRLNDVESWSELLAAPPAGDTGN